MTKSKDTNGNLREACLQQAIAIIADVGLEGLSLREVSRRLGVSHQAPYKHFPSRDHILAEIVRRTFNAFAEYLDNYPLTEYPYQNLRIIGQAYLHYAIEHPLEYRLMFGTPLPDPVQHPEMIQSAQHAFNLLRKRIHEIDPKQDDEDNMLDALFVWSAMHGLATILQGQALNSLSPPNQVIAAAPQHTLTKIGAALGKYPPF